MSSLARAVVGYEGAQRAATVHVGVCSALAMPKSARSIAAHGTRQTRCAGDLIAYFSLDMDSGHVAKRARTTPASSSGKPTASVNFTSEKLPFVTLTNAAGDNVKAYPFGACITSYVKGGKEMLAMRADNKMDGSKPISGGTPHRFPQFGPGAMQQHGFARNCVWDVAEITDGPSSGVKVRLLAAPQLGSCAC